jgi:hypothetical protein
MNYGIVLMFKEESPGLCAKLLDIRIFATEPLSLRLLLETLEIKDI